MEAQLLALEKQSFLTKNEQKQEIKADKCVQEQALCLFLTRSTQQRHRSCEVRTEERFERLLCAWQRIASVIIN